MGKATNKNVLWVFKPRSALAASEAAYLSHHAILVVVVVVVVIDRAVWIDHPFHLASSRQLNSKGYTKVASLFLLFRQLESNMAALNVLSAPPCGKCLNYGFFDAVKRPCSTCWVLRVTWEFPSFHLRQVRDLGHVIMLIKIQVEGKSINLVPPRRPFWPGPLSFLWFTDADWLLNN